MGSHTAWVVAAAIQILQEIDEALPNDMDKQALKELVLTGAVFHDLGKANNVFQDLLNRRLLRGHGQPLRHEILSALLICVIESPLKPWIFKLFQHRPDYWPWMIAWVAGGHHLRLHREKYINAEPIARTSGIPDQFIFYGDAVDDLFTILVKQLKHLDAPDHPKLERLKISVSYSDKINHRYLAQTFITESQVIARQLSQSEKELLAYAKAIVVAADVAGSALPKETSGPAKWINHALNTTVSDHELQKIVDDKLRGIKKVKKNFQEQVGTSRSPITLLIAGCGNGKTVAAYEWAKQFSGKKLIFCYPTTGTASAGFSDYLLSQNQLERALIHSRSQVDIRSMLGTREDDMLESNQRLESLKAWHQKVIACTVDTVLCLIQNWRLGLFSFPAFLKAAVVFDEIHHYDAKLFGSLLTFLETFPKIPVLLMSASLPSHRIDKLREIAGKRLSKPIQGDIEESYKRYRIEWKGNISDCWNQVENELRNNNGKVLWVCNTVSGSIRLYKAALDRVGLPVKPILYHSRFRYRDRVKIQENVIEKFRSKNQRCLVIATQVCEMSLHISASLMVTELAPFPSLIQRLGRLNREFENREGAHCFVYPFKCSENKPYRSDDLKEAERRIRQLAAEDNACSQAYLAELLAKMTDKEEIKRYSAWRNGVWESDQRPCRDGSNSITVIRSEDKISILSSCTKPAYKLTSQDVAEWTIPMLYKPGLHSQETLGGYPLVARDQMKYEYDEELKTGEGAQWL